MYFASGCIYHDRICFYLFQNANILYYKSMCIVSAVAAVSQTLVKQVTSFPVAAEAAGAISPWGSAELDFVAKLNNVAR